MEGQERQDRVQEAPEKEMACVTEAIAQTKTEGGSRGSGDKICMSKYTLLGPLGQGGEGSVYLAWDEHLLRYVAVKHVRESEKEGGDPDRQITGKDIMDYDVESEERGCSDKEENQDKKDQRGENRRERREQIMREADYLQQLSHPMLPAVYDLSGDGSGGWYLVMEYIQGQTLHTYIEQKCYVKESQARIWAKQLTNVLEYLHTRKPPVIYSDLKPDNIMVCPDGQLRLVDFGAALTRSFGIGRNQIMAVTPGYGAPEQSGAAPDRQGQGHAGTRAYADERSDIYALGKVLYYMVTGADPSRPPYTALPVYEYQPLLSNHLEAVIRKCIRTEPEERYQTAEEVQKDLDRSEGRGRRVRRKSFVRVIEKRIWLTEGNHGHFYVTES